MNDIIKHRNFVIGQIQKSFDDELEKARSGVYADTAENRKLGRVGQEYGHSIQQRETTDKQPNMSGKESGGSSAKLRSLFESGADIKTMLEAAGYTGLPKLVDELDTSKAWEGVTLHRGVQTEDFAKQLKGGQMHYGGGRGVNGGMDKINAFGAGIYAYAGGDAKAMTNIHGKTRVDMALSKSAKVADYDTLKSELLAKGVKLSNIASKISAYAISKGYHAIHQNKGYLHSKGSGKDNVGVFGKSDIIVVLDRRKLMIKR